MRYTWLQEMICPDEVIKKNQGARKLTDTAEIMSFSCIFVRNY